MRLIDADALIEVLAEHRDFNSPNLTPLVNEAMAGGLRIAIREVKNAPTVDIKTEVAREIFAEIDIPLQRFMNEHDYSIGNLIFDIDELKNKYIGGEKICTNHR